MNIGISVINSTGAILLNSSGIDEAVLVHEGEYKEGDSITITSDTFPVYLIIQLDHIMAPCFCFLSEAKTSFIIPFNEKRVSYAPFSFEGSRHYIHARRASESEILCRKNLAFNPYDAHENVGLFPHSKANVETRGESVFASRNAIDGYLASSYHGEWPFTSWGINRDPAAEFHLDFGRPVLIDEIVLYLRTDFPHDAWWKEVTVEFSDGSKEVFNLEKKEGAQHFAFDERVVKYLVLKNLIKADDPSPFPALTQIQVFGKDII
jgi:hypothetical protein